MHAGPNLRLTPARVDGLKVGVVSGQETPTIQGWYAKGHDERQPAPVVDYSISAKLPVTLCTALMPVEQGVPPSANVTVTSAPAGSYTVSVELSAQERISVTIDPVQGHAAIAK